MAAKSSTSPALRLILKAILNIFLVYALNKWMPQYVSVFGGAAAYVIIGSLITLLNVFVRPLLNLVTLPLHFFFALLTTIAVNGAFLWLVYQLTLRMDPSILAFTIIGGLRGWIVLSTVLGVANWIMKHI